MSLSAWNVAVSFRILSILVQVYICACSLNSIPTASVRPVTKKIQFTSVQQNTESAVTNCSWLLSNGRCRRNLSLLNIVKMEQITLLYFSYIILCLNLFFIPYLKNSVLWDITLCIPMKANRRFVEIRVYCLHFQVCVVSQGRNQHETDKKPWRWRQYVPPERRLTSPNYMAL
jgi:hypothetical protein